jgi:hypothetical protein
VLLLTAPILALAVSLPGIAGGGSGSADIPIYRAVIDESTRAKLVRDHLARHGRDFVLYRLEMGQLDEGILCAIGCESTTRYTIDRETTGTEKWMGLKLGNFLFEGIVEDLDFEPLPDRIHRQGGTNTDEFLRMAASEQINGLIHEGGGLEDVRDVLSMTYAFSAKDRAMIMAPTALHLVEDAESDEGVPLETSATVDIFSKHAFLARILNEEQSVDMAGELYLHIEPRAGTPPDQVLTNGRVDLGKVYDVESNVLDADRIEIRMVVKNDSGTFQPSGRRIAAFAWTLMKALRVDRIGFEAFGEESQPGVIEEQGHSTWEAYRAANPTVAGD